jgi:hypothetical protein
MLERWRRVPVSALVQKVRDVLIEVVAGLVIPSLLARLFRRG